MKIVTVVPVRMRSSRLPGKVLMPVLDKPLLGHLLDRLECCDALGEIVVATSTGADNDAIATYCDERGVAVFRGSETDVLERLVQALTWLEAKIGVLVFGDCPLIDPAIIKQAVTFFQSHAQYDFVGNDLSTTWPPGMEVEVFKMAALEDSARRCTDAVIREHGTLYLRQHSKIYCLHNLDAPAHLYRPDLSLEVDVPQDLAVIEGVLKAFDGLTNITLEQIIDYLDGHPELTARSRDVVRHWKPYRIG